MSHSKKNIFIAELAAVIFMAVCLILFIGQRFTNKAEQVSYRPVTLRPEIQSPRSGSSEKKSRTSREEAEALFKEKKYLESQKLCNKILAKNKYDYDIVLLRGRCLYYQDQYQTAKVDFYFLIDNGQHLYKANKYIGACFYKQNQYSSAKLFFEKALPLAVNQEQKNKCSKILDLIDK